MSSRNNSCNLLEIDTFLQDIDPDVANPRGEMESRSDSISIAAISVAGKLPHRLPLDRDASTGASVQAPVGLKRTAKQRNPRFHRPITFISRRFDAPSPTLNRARDRTRQPCRRPGRTHLHAHELQPGDRPTFGGLLGPVRLWRASRRL
jgi:hypothetical protein